MTMRSVARPRQYVPPSRLTILRPLLEYNDWRDAYILRAVGDRIGPVVRADRRRDQTVIYAGPERRAATRSSPARSPGARALSR